MSFTFSLCTTSATHYLKLFPFLIIMVRQLISNHIGMNFSPVNWHKRVNVTSSRIELQVGTPKHN